MYKKLINLLYFTKYANRNMRYKWNYDLLGKTIAENNVILSHDYKKEKLHKDFIIEGNCIKEKCINNFCKSFRSMVKNLNFLCSDCSKKNGREKYIKTNLKKYGVDNPSKIKEVREKAKKTTFERHGVENYRHHEDCEIKMKNTTLERYGVEHYSQTNEFNEKYKTTCLERYGVENYSQTNEFNEKFKNTCLERYGAEHNSQTDEYLEKRKNTNLERYGVEHFRQSVLYDEKYKITCLEKYGVENATKNEDVKQKMKNTTTERYGVEYYSQTNEFHEKFETTSLERYGTKHPNQNPEILKKIISSSFSKKEYKLPSGKIILIQGYEHMALDELLYEENINEDQIIIGVENVPIIVWNDINDKSHNHFPDIYIKTQNRLVEVKSSWTAKLHENDIFLKLEYAKKQGYNYEIWVYNGKGEKVECYK